MDDRIGIFTFVFHKLFGKGDRPRFFGRSIKRSAMVYQGFLGSSVRGNPSLSQRKTLGSRLGIFSWKGFSFFLLRMGHAIPMDETQAKMTVPLERSLGKFNGVDYCSRMIR